MARLGTYNFCLADPHDRKSKIQFKYVVHVLTDGEFTTTIPLAIAEELMDKGIELATNKADNPGYFISDTLDGLSRLINAKVEQYFSRELILKEDVIVYDITSNIAYCRKDGLTGDIVPNGGWATERDNYHWFHGTKGHQGWDGDNYGINFYAKVYRKETYRYIDNREVIEMKNHEYYDSWPVDPNDPEYNMKFLASVPQMPRNGAAMEIPFTEQNAKFFVDLFKAFAILSEKIIEFRQPDNLLEHIHNGTSLLGTSKTK